MATPEHRQEQLERWLAGELRALPPRRAPASLESRVLAAIAQHANLPWWKQHFLRWPLAARLGFLALAALIAQVSLQASAWLIDALRASGASEAIANPARALRNDWSFIQSMNDIVQVVLNAIPAPWLYGTLAVVGLMYATLFGIGSIAFRTLNQERT